MSETDDQKESAQTGPIHAVVDRIEDGGMAVLLLGDDEKTQFELPLSLLPEGTSDGDHLRIIITPDRRSRVAAADRIRKLQEQLTQAGGAQEEQKDFKL